MNHILPTRPHGKELGMIIKLNKAVNGTELYNALNKVLLEFKGDRFFNFKVDLEHSFGPEPDKKTMHKFALSLFVYKEKGPTVGEEFGDWFRQLFRKEPLKREVRPNRARYFMFEFPTIQADESYDEVTVIVYDVHDIYDFEFGFYKGSDRKVLFSPPERALSYFDKFSQSLLRNLEANA